MNDLNKNKELMILKFLKANGESTLEDIDEKIKELNKKKIKRVLDHLIELELVIKNEKSGMEYYKNIDFINENIAPLRSIAAGTGTSTGDSSAEPLFSIGDISDKIAIDKVPMQEVVQEVPEIELLPDSLESPYLLFEMNLEETLKEKVPWKKELIKYLIAEKKGETEGSIKLLKKCIKIAQKKGTIEQILDLYNRLAYKFKDNSQKIKEIYQEAIRSIKHFENKKYLAELYIKMGNYLFNNRDYENALFSYKDGLQLAEKNNLSFYIHTLYQKIANIYKKLNQFNNALDFYYKDLDLYKKENNLNVPALYNQIGGVLIKLDKNEEAIEYFDKAYSIYEQQGDNRNQILTLMNKNIALYNLRRWNDLGQLYLKILDLIYDPSLKEQLWHELSSILPLITDKKILGDLTDKIKSLSKIEVSEIEIRRARTATKMAVSSILASNEVSEALWNFNIGVAKFVEGDLDSAEEFYKKSRDIYLQLGDFKGVGICNYHIGLINIQKKNYDVAINELKEAAKYFENIKRKVAVEQYRITLQADIVPILESLSYAYIMNNDYYNALESIEKGKNREIVRMMEGFNIFSCPKIEELINKENNLVGEFQELETNINELKSSFYRGELHLDAYKRDLRELNNKIESISNELRTLRTQIYEKCAEGDPGKIPLSLDYSIISATKKSLKGFDTIIVEFFYYKPQSKIYLLVFHPDQKIDHFAKSIDNIKLLNLIDKLKSGVNTLDDKILEDSSEELFNMIIPEAFAQKYLDIDTEKSLIMIPHSELFMIPWEILKNPHNSGDWDGYFGLEYLIARNFSLDLTRIMLSKYNKKKGKKILLLGNPTNDLFGAYREVIEIGNCLKSDKVKILVGDDITRNFLKNTNLDEFGVIHYAGHADFIETDPSLSVLLLSDGTFTAREMSSLKLNNSLFYISACETGQAKGTGGGEVFGIIRGLTLAGAQTIISTNWQVSDDSAKDMALNFYKALNEGKTAVEALRESRRYVRKKYKNILHWASTTIYGNPLFKL